MSASTALSMPPNRYGSGSVTAVGVLTIVGSAGSLLLALFVAMSSSDAPFSRTMHWTLVLLMLGFGVLGVATGIGLLLRDHWARVLGIALAIIAFGPGRAILEFRTDLVGFVVDLIISVAVPLWCLIVLARSRANAEFSSYGVRTRPPAAISAIAWLLLSSIVCVPFLFFRLPFFFMGHALLGWSGTLAALFVYLLDVVAGLALLRRKMAGLWLAMGLQVYGICSGLIQDFNPAARTEFYKHVSQIMIRIGFPAGDLPSQLSGPFFSFVTPMLIATCLLTFWDEYREASLKAGAESTEA